MTTSLDYGKLAKAALRINNEFLELVGCRERINEEIQLFKKEFKDTLEG